MKWDADRNRRCWPPPACRWRTARDRSEAATLLQGSHENPELREMCLSLSKGNLSWDKAMKTLSDPNRILIVHALIPGPACVSEISARSGLSVHRVSHHLGRLRLTGIVTCTRQGRSIIYRIAESILSENGLNLGYCHVRFR